MTLETKKKCFVELGRFLSQFSEDKTIKNPSVLHNETFLMILLH
jgi:hypothetical protein